MGDKIKASKSRHGIVPGTEDEDGMWLDALWLVFRWSGVLTDSDDEAASFWLWLCRTCSHSVNTLII